MALAMLRHCLCEFIPFQDLYTDTEKEDEMLMTEEVERVRHTINDFWKTKAGLSRGTPYLYISILQLFCFDKACLLQFV